MPSALTLRSLESSRRSAASVLSSCSALSRMQVTNGCPAWPVHVLPPFGAQLQRLKVQILEFDRMIRAWHRSSEASRRLDDIPGVGPALATALVASAPVVNKLPDSQMI